MKLLICTQKVSLDDDVLGFMHGWIKAFAASFEQVTVICLLEGNHSLPGNVKVLSLGKEKKRSRIRYVYNFLRYITQYRKEYDAVFVHMNPEYVLLGAIFWKLLGKKVTLWYAHGHPSRMLKMAVPLSDIVFTSVQEACRIETPKLAIIGQGIPVDAFTMRKEKIQDESFQVVSIGRISPSKDYETLISAAEILRRKGMRFHVRVVGGAGLPDQEKYFSLLKTLISEKNLSDVFSFLGPVPNSGIAKILQSVDLFASMTHTGSLDKAGLEAMAAGVPLVTCGEAFASVLGDLKNICMYPKKDAAVLALRIEYFAKLPINEREKISVRMRENIRKNHSLDSFVRKILSAIQKLP